eukprot:m.711654 g.711654  ORF g.711654 m.711654 type:complete len:216 (+) comp58773_c0_seq6:1846-2493(+)
MSAHSGQIPPAITSELIDAAGKANAIRLAELRALMASPRSPQKPSVPAHDSFAFEEGKGGLIVGPGGKNMKDVHAATGVTVRLEGSTYHLFGPGPDAVQKAHLMIQALLGGPPSRDGRPTGFRRREDSNEPGNQQTGFRLALIPGEEYVAVVADARGENLVVTAKEVRIGVSRQSVPAAMRAGLRRGQEVRVLFEGRDQNGRLAARILEPASSRS